MLKLDSNALQDFGGAKIAAASVAARRTRVGRAACYKIDAMQHLGTVVEAYLVVLPVAVKDDSQDRDVLASLEALMPEFTIGFHDQFLVANVDSYLRHRDLIAVRITSGSSVQHNCSNVMELSMRG
ncbi:hypothetical protein [Sodalis sp.]|uniref:hypothetical protein n=1 Tax=Sodalis sp. (in: enterobacteria) TaxID=1898979 RepID=UPI003873AF26